MFFDSPDLELNIISVLELNWNESHDYAAPRPFHALSYRIRGGAYFTHGNVSEYVGQGEIIYVPAGFDYSIDAENEHLIVVHFELGNNSGDCIDNMEVISPTDTKYFENKFCKLYSSWTKKQLAYRYECKSELYKVLMRLYKQKSEQKIDFTNDKMNEVMEYIHDHFTEQDMNVASLAEMANMSDTYFRKLFVSAFSETPLRYINSLRVSRALELLRSGYYSVEAVAEKCGFDNPKYLSTVIKNATGFPPLHFKHGIKTDTDISE